MIIGKLTTHAEHEKDWAMRFAALVLFLVAMPFTGNAKELPVPHDKDETQLVLIKANPRDYVGRAFILCGAVEISDYYNYWYSDDKDTFYVLGFREAGETTGDFGTEYVHIYVHKQMDIARTLIDIIAGYKAANPKERPIMRFKATIRKAAYDKDQQWNMMELVDFQFPKNDFSGWEPTWGREYIKAAQDAERRKVIDETEEKIKKLQADAAVAKAAEEASKWRTWSDAAGGNKVEARFGGVLSGNVRLTKKDGTKIEIPLENLSAEDRDWIKNRKK